MKVILLPIQWGKLKQRFSMYDTAGLSAQVQKNLRLIILAVVFGNMSFVVTNNGTALTGYIKALGASDFVYSVIIALPLAANALQLVASYIMEKTKARRSMMLTYGFISRLMWLPVALVPFVVPMEMDVVRIWAVLVLITLSAGSGAFLSTAFNSMAADVVPLRIRGRYFGARYRLMMASGILAGLVFGWILDAYTQNGSMLGYGIVIAMAAIFGTLDIVCLVFVKTPPMVEDETGDAKEKAPFSKMLQEVFANKRYMRLILFATVWQFCVNLASPFFNVFCLNEVAMSYSEINLCAAISYYAGALLTVTFWGKLLDRYGSKPVLRLCCCIATVLPLLWQLAAPREFWIIPFSQMLSGIIWPAIELALQNMYFAQSPDKNRSVFLAVYFCLTQLIGAALAYSVGGWLVDNVMVHLAQLTQFSLYGPPSQYKLLFLFSAVLRLLCCCFLLPMVYGGEDKTVREMLSAGAKRIRFLH